jgi:hypothetical protein
MHLDYHGFKHAGLYRTSDNRNYSNCNPTQIPI